jgi:hypothetical protein
VQGCVEAGGRLPQKILRATFMSLIIYQYQYVMLTEARVNDGVYGLADPEPAEQALAESTLFSYVCDISLNAG